MARPRLAEKRRDLRQWQRRLGSSPGHFQ